MRPLEEHRRRKFKTKSKKRPFFGKVIGQMEKPASQKYFIFESEKRFDLPFSSTFSLDALPIEKSQKYQYQGIS